jgi:hypothetical protein
VEKIELVRKGTVFVHGDDKRTLTHADIATGIIYVSQNIVVAPAAYDVLGRKTRQPFRSMIPISDLSIAIDEVDSVVESIEDAGSEFSGRGCGHFRSLVWTARERRQIRGSGNGVLSQYLLSIDLWEVHWHI